MSLFKREKLITTAVSSISFTIQEGELVGFWVQMAPEKRQH